MQLKELGEWGLISYISSRFPKQPYPGIEGIGDDCAIIPYQGEESLLVTTDLLIENTHFLRKYISAKDLGYKSLVVNISDIAAMGGTPLYAFLSLALSSDIPLTWVEDFFEGLEQISKEEGVLILGGDTTRASKEVFINIALIGKIKTEQIKRRSQAQIGDLICCTGYLGDSAAGLKILLDQLPMSPQAHALVTAHHHPSSHLKQGCWLATQSAVHAMIDISDGLDSDIKHIIQQSHCGASIDVQKIPISKPLYQIAAEAGWNAREIALAGGEDYCLLCTVDPSAYENLNQLYFKKFGQPLFKIGEIIASPNLHYFEGKKKIKLKLKGFQHFFS